MLSQCIFCVWKEGEAGTQVNLTRRAVIGAKPREVIRRAWEAVLGC